MVAILLVFAVFASAAGLRLGYWQVVAADELTATIPAAAALPAEEAAVRADITDRDGELLAKLVTYDSLDAHPDIMDPEDHEAIVDTLDTLIGLQPDERAQFLALFADSSSQYEVLRNRLTFEESEAIGTAIEQRLLPGIMLDSPPVTPLPDQGR